MFIGKRKFESVVHELRREIEGMNRRIKALEDKLVFLDEFVEMDEEDRKAEKSFLQGISNIMSFRG